MQTKSMLFTLLGTVLVVGAMAGVFAYMQANATNGTPEELAALATCLTDSGAKFYGAFTCPHCQDQKADFGDASDLVPYVECATPDGRGQTEACAAAGITAYPTWQFSNGQQANGRVSLALLAEVTGCPAPAIETS